MDGAKGSTTKCASILGSAPCSKNIGGGPIKLTLLKREKNRKKEKLSQWNPSLMSRSMKRTPHYMSSNKGVQTRDGCCKTKMCLPIHLSYSLDEVPPKATSLHNATSNWLHGNSIPKIGFHYFWPGLIALPKNTFPI